MRSRVACSLFAAFSFVCWSPADDKPAKKLDTEAIQGEWKIKYFEEQGEVTPPEKFKSMVYALADGKIAIKNDGKIMVEGKVDSSKEPKYIDLKVGDENVPGIYQLDGDNLTICAPAVAAKADRPKEFKAPKGSGMMLMKLERIKE